MKMFFVLLFVGLTLTTIPGCSTVKTLYDLQRCGGSGNCG